MWGDLEVGRNERWVAVLEGVVVFGQVFAEQRVGLRWPTLADQEFGIVIVAMLLTTKETRWNHRPVSSDTGTQVMDGIRLTRDLGASTKTEIPRDFAQSSPWFPLYVGCLVG